MHESISIHLYNDCSNHHHQTGQTGWLYTYIFWVSSCWVNCLSIFSFNISCKSCPNVSMAWSILSCSSVGQQFQFSSKSVVVFFISTFDGEKLPRIEHLWECGLDCFLCIHGGESFFWFSGSLLIIVCQDKIMHSILLYYINLNYINYILFPVQGFWPLFRTASLCRSLKGTAGNVWPWAKFSNFGSAAGQMETEGGVDRNSLPSLLLAGSSLDFVL